MTPMTRWRMLDRVMVLVAAILSGASIGTSALLLWLVFQPVGTWLSVAEPVLVGPSRVYAPGDAMTLRLQYEQAQSRSVYIGVTFASTGYLGVTPVMLTALPPGHHEVALQVTLPSGLRPGEYRAYVMIAARLSGWGAEPLVVVSEIFQVVDGSP